MHSSQPIDPQKRSYRIVTWVGDKLDTSIRTARTNGVCLNVSSLHRRVEWPTTIHLRLLSLLRSAPDSYILRRFSSWSLLQMHLRRMRFLGIVLCVLLVDGQSLWKEDVKYGENVDVTGRLSRLVAMHNFMFSTNFILGRDIYINRFETTTYFHRSTDTAFFTAYHLFVLLRLFCSLLFIPFIATDMIDCSEIYNF